MFVYKGDVTKLPDGLPHTWQSELELSASQRAHLEPRKMLKLWIFPPFFCMMYYLKSKFIFDGHDHLHMIETVKTKIVDKMTV